MSTQLQQPSEQTGSFTLGSAPAQGSGDGIENPLFQFSVGPAALSQAYIYEAMALYSLIIANKSEQRISGIKEIKTSAVGNAEATREAGEAIGKALVTAAFLTMAGAVLSITVALGSEWASNKLTNAGKQASTLEEEIDPLANISNHLSVEKAPSGAGPGSNPSYRELNKKLGPGSEDTKDTQGKKLGEHVEDRVKAFNKGEYKDAKTQKRTLTDRLLRREDTRVLTEEQNDAVTREAISQMKARSGTDGNPKWETTEERMRGEHDRLTRAQSSAAQTAAANAQRSSLLGNLPTKAFEGGASYVQGDGQKEQAAKQAVASLEQSLSQMASQASQDGASAVTKAAQAQDQEVDALNRIQATNSVR